MPRPFAVLHAVQPEGAELLTRFRRKGRLDLPKASLEVSLFRLERQGDSVSEVRGEQALEKAFPLVDQLLVTLGMDPALRGEVMASLLSLKSRSSASSTIPGESPPNALAGNEATDKAAFATQPFQYAGVPVPEQPIPSASSTIPGDSPPNALAGNEATDKAAFATQPFQYAGVPVPGQPIPSASSTIPGDSPPNALAGNEAMDKTAFATQPFQYAGVLAPEQPIPSASSTILGSSPPSSASSTIPGESHTRSASSSSAGGSPPEPDIDRLSVRFRIRMDGVDSRWWLGHLTLYCAGRISFTPLPGQKAKGVSFKASASRVQDLSDGPRGPHKIFRWTTSKYQVEAVVQKPTRALAPGVVQKLLMVPS